MKILLLEDDLILSEIITEHLEYDNHQVTPIYNGIQAENIIFEEQFDLLLLDVNVPLLSGFELGANDYLKKPFEMIELKARIENTSI